MAGPLRQIQWGTLLVASVILGTLGLDSSGSTFASINLYWDWLLIGFFGALLAGAVGAGSGLFCVFVMTGSGAAAVAPSFGIQAFGLTMAAITWLVHLQRRQKSSEELKSFRLIFLVAASSSLAGLRITQDFLMSYHWDFFPILEGADVVVALVLAWQIIRSRRNKSVTMSNGQLVGLSLVAMLGGVLMAWYSLGVGEVLVLYSVCTRLRCDFAIALAVCVTAITAITALPYYFDYSAIHNKTLIFGGCGALLGGILAPKIGALLNSRDESFSPE